METKTPRAHRRHLQDCPHIKKGQRYTLCGCPIWIDANVNGKRIRRSLDTNDWGRAQEMIKTMVSGGTINAPQLTDRSVRIGTLVEKYLANAKFRELSEGTLASYRNTFDAFLEHFDPARTCASITPEQIEDFQSKKGNMASSNRMQIIHVRCLFRFGIGRKLITENPAQETALPEVHAEPTLPFTETEENRLMIACDVIKTKPYSNLKFYRQWVRTLLTLLFNSGLRITDALMLRRDQMNWETRHIEFKMKKTQKRLKIQLLPETLAALKTLPALHPDYFFYDGKKKALRITTNELFRRLGELAKVENAHPHRCRDTFASRLLEKDVPLRTVQLLLGHISIKTTEKHYGHFVASHQALLDRATATLAAKSKPARLFKMKTV